MTRSELLLSRMDELYRKRDDLPGGVFRTIQPIQGGAIVAIAINYNPENPDAMNLCINPEGEAKFYRNIKNWTDYRERTELVSTLPPETLVVGSRPIGRVVRRTIDRVLGHYPHLTHATLYLNTLDMKWVRPYQRFLDIYVARAYEGTVEHHILVDETIFTITLNTEGSGAEYEGEMEGGDGEL